jgi:hypothetical protein
MSNDFRKTLVKDSRLMVTDSLNYAVLKGGQSVVSQVASAIAASSSTVNFNVQVPSEQTIVDRRVFVKTTVAITFQTTNAVPLIYGQNVALAAYPFHQCCSTVQATLNNNVTSINVRDVLPFLIRSNDSREMSKASSSCPTAADKLYVAEIAGGAYGDLYASQASSWNVVPASRVYNRLQTVPQNAMNTTFGVYNNGGIDTDLTGNGSYAGYGTQTLNPNTATDGPVSLYWNNAGTYQLQNIVAPVEQTDWKLVFTTIEPVLVQPFLYSDPVSNKQGMYGLQTIQLQYNIADASRAFRVSNRVADVANIVITNAPQVISVSNASLIFKYLTPHPSDLLPARNVIPLLTYDRYFSNAQNTAMAVNYGSESTITSNTYNLTQIPDKICIFLRKRMTTQRPTDLDAVPVITNISLNFNNNAGLLSSATLQDLYYYSVMAGSNQTFSEFCGQANGSSIYEHPGYPQGTGFLNGNSAVISTVGSYLMLDFATVIQLTEDFYAPGSLGNFQLQFTVKTSCREAIVANTLELVLVVMNSGIMVTDRGQTSTYTGILTKNDVLEASQQEPFSVADVQRKVGSGHRGRALPKHMFKGLRGHPEVVASKLAVVPAKAMDNRLM